MALAPPRTVAPPRSDAGTDCFVDGTWIKDKTRRTKAPKRPHRLAPARGEPPRRLPFADAFGNRKARLETETSLQFNFPAGRCARKRPTRQRHRLSKIWGTQIPN